jgi:putative intracellular protease/amidase
MSVTPIEVLLIPFPDFNTLDLNGPLEILGNAALPTGTFSVTIAAKDELTKAFENIVIKRTISFAKAKETLEDYDILIQPGGGPQSIMPHLVPGDDSFTDLLEIVTIFSKLGPSPRIDAGERVIMSICTGALFYGYAGVFDGLTATTHHLAIDQLQQVCKEYVSRTSGAKGTTVIPPSDTLRYVDAGLNERKVRVISSGGISCGLDATLYLVSLRLGKDWAVAIAEMMEYKWTES